MTASVGILSARGLCHAWAGGPSLFDGLDLDLPAGVSLLQGEEGCGKTTLFKLLSGELLPGRGTLIVGGIPLATQPERYRQQVFRTDPRSAALDGFTPTSWFDAMGQRYPDFRRDALPELIHGFSLDAHIHKPMYMLSTGSQRKVWLCAALAAGAPVTLLDEPFAALDAPSIRYLTQCLQDASPHNTRAWVLADHAAPEGVDLSSVIRV